MYSFAITCFSYKKEYFVFKREFTAGDLAEYELSDIADKITNVCINYGVKKATFKVSITDWWASYLPHTIRKKIATSYENILTLLERAIYEYISPS